jgi:NAD+ diphosphatase
MSDSVRSRLALARQELDRDYLSRARPGLFEELWAEPATRVIVLSSGKALLSSTTPPRLALLPVSSAPEAELLLYLGRSVSATSPEPVGTPIVAAVVSDDAAESVMAGSDGWADLRSIGAAMTDRDAGVLTEALALANWHRSHRFSPRTGEALIPELGGWVRRSAGDSAQVFPRTDAAIIVLVTDAEDRILLGSNALWESSRYSLLAGFVEPGESLEAAVAREVFEESGIRVTDPVYVGSQPWPFPASLMLGFRARVDTEREWIQEPDGEEILDLRWFTRDELRDAGDIILPGRTSIARAMIEDWLGEPIDPRS